MPGDARKALHASTPCGCAATCAKSGLTATVTATAAANGYQQRPVTAHNARTIRGSLGVRPGKRKVVRQHRVAGHLAYALRACSGRVPEMSPNCRQQPAVATQQQQMNMKLARDLNP